MTDTTALLPCPFCGGTARQSSGPGAYHPWYGTGCSTRKCPAELHMQVHDSQEAADAAWNTRAALAAAQQPAVAAHACAATAVVDHAQQPAEPARPDIIERLSYHALERDDLTLDDCLDYLASGWKRVRGRSEREMVMQILALLAASPASAGVDSAAKPDLSTTKDSI